MYGHDSNTRLGSGASHLAETRRSMRQVGPDTYVCTLCDTRVAVSGLERPVVMLAAESGHPNLRIVSVAGVEVHRCVVSDTPT